MISLYKRWTLRRHIYDEDEYIELIGIAETSEELLEKSTFGYLGGWKVHSLETASCFIESVKEHEVKTQKP